MEKRVVVFISGFLTPPNWVSYPLDTIPADVRVINVYPSATGSLHDRACQVFYELVGGTVDFGEEHSAFHGHSRFGVNYPVGKYPNWSEKNPIQLVGHSFGGLTAWVLQNYLAQKRFPGFNTNENWVSSLVAVNCPFNGVIRVHDQGLHRCMPPVVRWCSQGYVIGLLVNIFEYFDWTWLRKILNFGQAHWNINYSQPNSLMTLIHSFLGVCIHSTTDNISYDASIKSQLQWSKTLKTFENTLYFSVVGKKERKGDSLVDKLYYLFGYFEKFAVAGKQRTCTSSLTTNKHSVASHYISGVNTSQWMSKGSDLLLSVHTQEHPRLNRTKAGSREGIQVTPESLQQNTAIVRGRWHYIHCDLTHLTVSFQDTTAWTTIWKVCEVLSKQHQGRPLTASEEKQSGAIVNFNQPPDMQCIDYSMTDRHTLLFPWSSSSQLVLELVRYLLAVMICCAVDSFLPVSGLALVNYGIGVIVSGEVFRIVQEYFDCDSSKGAKGVSSDVTELIFAFLRWSALLKGDSGGNVNQWLLLQSFLYLFEFYALHLSSHCKHSNLVKYLNSRKGIREYSLLRLKLLLGLSYAVVSVVSRSNEVNIAGINIEIDKAAALGSMALLVNAILFIAKTGWLIVNRWSRGLLSDSIAYRLLMGLWLCLFCSVLISTVHGVNIVHNCFYYFRVESSSTLFSCIGGVVSLFVVWSVSFVKWRDLSEGFQFMMIKVNYKQGRQQ